MQDKHGADVDLLLHLLHLASGGRTVSVGELARLDAAARGWREAVIAPLRTVRRQLKNPKPAYKGTDALRQAVEAVEIEAERMQFGFLHAFPVVTQAAPTSVVAARESLAAYCDLLAVPRASAAALLEHFERHEGPRRRMRRGGNRFQRKAGIVSEI